MLLQSGEVFCGSNCNRVRLKKNPGRLRETFLFGQVDSVQFGKRLTQYLLEKCIVRKDKSAREVRISELKEQLVICMLQMRVTFLTIHRDLFHKHL